MSSDEVYELGCSAKDPTVLCGGLLVSAVLADTNQSVIVNL